MIQLPKYPFITGYFKVTPQQCDQHPCRRVEPVHRRRRECKQLPEVIKPSHVHLFMQQNIGQEVF